MTKESQTITLSDGRKLGYAEYGDPKGKPVLLFHGWPGSRLGAILYDNLVKKLHIRLISIDRPGYGLSDFKKKRTILDWADDIKEFVDILKLKKFAVLGISGGGPYALACAYKIPEKITRIGIVSGMGPVKEDAMIGAKKWWRFLMKRYANLFFAKFVTSIHYIESTFFPRSFINMYRKKFDSDVLTDKIIEQITVSKEEAFHTGINGVAQDLVLYSRDWGFTISDIAKEIYLWYGENDSIVPLFVGKFYQSHLPKTVLKIYPNEAHSVFVSHTEEILKTLM